MAKKKDKKRFDAHEIMPRYHIVMGILVFFCIAIMARAGYLMFFEHDYWKDVSARFTRQNDTIQPTRGNILAAGGEVLATSLPEYRMYLDFMSYEKDSLQKVRDQYRRDTLLFQKQKVTVTTADSIRFVKELGKREGTAKYLEMRDRPPLVQPLKPNARLDSIALGLKEIFPDLNPDSLKARIVKARLKGAHNFPVYPHRVSYITYRRVKALPVFRLSANIGGFYNVTYRKRKNPYGALARRTIGDLYGEKDSARCGLELAFDTVLRGKYGISHRQKVSNRYLTIPDTLATDGCDVQTTIDVAMQDICEKALGDQLRTIGGEFGVCILMEVATGDVKAITSLSRCADGEYREIASKAVSNLMEPGSVFKPMSFMVAMDDGYIHMNDQIYTGTGTYEMHGRKMKDSNWTQGGNGLITVPQCIQMSSNIGVSRLIDQYYFNQPEKFVDGIYRIGVAEDLKLPIPGYAKPKIRRPSKDKSNWSNTALAWMSIGYETQIPPISTLTFYNGVANGGKMVRPRFVTAIKRNGEIVKEYPVEVIREQMCKQETLKNIQECLFRVVNEPLHATGKQARSKHFNISGKTGTAQVWTKAGFSSQYLVSFAGYFPSEKPQYSMIVCIKKGSPAYGGLHCCPVFKRVAETVMAQHHEYDYSRAKDSVNRLSPILLPGNLNALGNVLESLNINHDKSPYTPSKDGTVWGKAHNSSNFSLRQEQTPEGTMPDVTGYGMRDAVYRLEKLGLRVHVQGKGRVVKQSIAPGSRLKKGMRIDLSFGDNKGNVIVDEDKEESSPEAPTEKKDTTKKKEAAESARKQDA